MWCLVVLCYSNSVCVSQEGSCGAPSPLLPPPRLSRLPRFLPPFRSLSLPRLSLPSCVHPVRVFSFFFLTHVCVCASVRKRARVCACLCAVGDGSKLQGSELTHHRVVFCRLLPRPSRSARSPWRSSRDACRLCCWGEERRTKSGGGKRVGVSPSPGSPFRSPPAIPTLPSRRLCVCALRALSSSPSRGASDITLNWLGGGEEATSTNGLGTAAVGTLHQPAVATHTASSQSCKKEEKNVGNGQT